MPTIGAPLHKWTLFLLLCSVPTYASTQAANETAITTSGATAASSTTTQASVVTPLTSSQYARRYVDIESTCPFRTINYITHTLPQQCARATRSAPGEAQSAVNASVADAEATARLPPHRSGTEEGAADSIAEVHDNATPTGRSDTPPAAETTAITASTVLSAEPDPELETDSPFDNANFLSFEEWKKKNLEQVGQSPENVGQGRAAPSNQPARRRPVNVNALDSLGDEGEIEIDFTGFGAPAEGGHVQGTPQTGTQNVEASKAKGEEGKVAPSSWAPTKDAGKTCKERFNYASFDCAATVLKTNKQAKSSSSVLVENKDSYMLNECSADNKFLIVELCDDILVDTIVLANYEFFSSMFRHFRVSVSDRYPVKMERWRTLGTFEARNARDIQPFLIKEPQIWARYLRIEFLTQFGNEFYCPLSLLRVHGTTMMEQFRREEEEARGVEDDDGDLEAESRDVVKPAEDSGPLPPDQISNLPINNHKTQAEESIVIDDAPQNTDKTKTDPQNHEAKQQAETSGQSHGQTTAATPPSQESDSPLNTSPFISSTSCSPSPVAGSVVDGKWVSAGNQSTTLTESSSTSSAGGTSAQSEGSSSNATSDAPSPTAHRSAASHSDNTTSSTSSSSQAARASDNGTVGSAPAQPPPRGSQTQPNNAVPSTQESFFKSIHKRLLYLEANSTLSLQYIEEQSRILRDAFIKVEKRQLAKTEKFLDHLNSTVMIELKGFRSMYDQLWQSTVIELESMKERQRSEVGEIGTRLSLLADELVWQKRMAVVQSTLLLLCLGLVLFVRSGTLSTASDAPIVRQLGSKYTSFFESPPPRGDEPPGLARRRRTFRNMWRSDTSAGLSDRHSDGLHAASDADTDDARSPVQLEYSPPTPDTPASLGARDAYASSKPDSNSSPSVQNQDGDHTPIDSDDQAARVQVLETQSGPATPNGTRDSRPSWEEVDRAIGQLKAEEQGLPTPKETKKARDRKKKRSPLRRAHSSYDGVADDSPSQDDDGSGLFL